MEEIKMENQWNRTMEKQSKIIILRLAMPLIFRKTTTTTNKQIKIAK